MKKCYIITAFHYDDTVLMCVTETRELAEKEIEKIASDETSYSDKDFGWMPRPSVEDCTIIELDFIESERD